MSQARNAEPRPLTGRKVLFITIAAFGVIIAANMTLVVMALKSFPGLEHRNGYVASRYFESERIAQQRLGWMSSAQYENGRVAVAIRDRAGAPAPIEAMSLRIGRPATNAEDVTPSMILDGSSWIGRTTLGPGLWRVDLAAVGLKGEKFRQQFTLRVAQP